MDNTVLDELYAQTRAACTELINIAHLQAGEILVVGCSTSEVRGEKIGSAGSSGVAEKILAALMEVCQKHEIFLAIQCCEHLNRALVVEREALTRYGLEEVGVIPVPKAGGALAAEAMHKFSSPTVVEFIKAQAGLDIGSTLIGMHLKHVAVPVRLTQKYIGQALLTAARTRAKLIGGARAVYILQQGEDK